jgi:hypothetical protein
MGSPKLACPSIPTDTTPNQFTSWTMLKKFQAVHIALISKHNDALQLVLLHTSKSGRK